MNNNIPEVRMFAGPHGSGKTTINRMIPRELLGVNIHPGEILEAIVNHGGVLDLAGYGVHTNATEIVSFFKQWRFFEQSDLLDETGGLSFRDDTLRFGSLAVNANLASVVAAMFRQRLLEVRVRFSFETVLSIPETVLFWCAAQESGYRTYLYYVATDNPDIIVGRIRSRVAMGGNPVPEDKIIRRYFLSLDFLKEAVSHSNRAYIFDNSEQCASPNRRYYRWSTPRPENSASAKLVYDCVCK